MTGNRLGQVAAPAAAGLGAGAVGAAAPFVLLGAQLLVSSGVAVRPLNGAGAHGPVAGRRSEGPALRRTGDI